MGGPGSGSRWSKKDTVEESRELDISFFTRESILRANTWYPGSIFWSNSLSGERTGSIGYEINTRDIHESWIRLHYTVTRPSGEKKAMDYRVPLTTTNPHYGGLRWWFVCSLTANGQPSWRRVRKLYLPSGGLYFGCRHCYDLTYESCQDSHKYDRMFAEMAAGVPGMSASEVKEMFKQDW
jgi:hypothetical protein